MGNGISKLNSSSSSFQDHEREGTKTDPSMLHSGPLPLNSSHVDTRSADVGIESKTRAKPYILTPKRQAALAQASKHRAGPFKCDWCAVPKPEIRKSGPRICNDCWRAHCEKKRAVKEVATMKRFGDGKNGRNRP